MKDSSSCLQQTSEGAIPGPYMYGVDVAPAGDDAKVSDLLPFYEVKRYLPTELVVATGGYETRGSLWAIQIVVNRDIPLTKLTMKQLDDIFGAERTGGWEGVFYTGKYARPASENIRTWGQLGLTGEFANKPIQTYGYIAPGFEVNVERKLFHWNDKWNENFKEYVEEKEIVPDADGRKVASERMYEELSKDKYGIAWGPLLHSKKYPNVKQISLSEDGGPYVPMTLDTVQNRTYPFKRDAYIYIDQQPGKPMEIRRKSSCVTFSAVKASPRALCPGANRSGPAALRSAARQGHTRPALRGRARHRLRGRQRYADPALPQARRTLGRGRARRQVQEDHDGLDPFG